jgi:hypothetical protein
VELESRQADEILEQARTRLIWSRVQELQSRRDELLLLKNSMRGLFEALEKMEEAHSRIEKSIAVDLAGAEEVVAACIPDKARERYAQAFTQFFKALIGHLMPN